MSRDARNQLNILLIFPPLIGMIPVVFSRLRLIMKSMQWVKQAINQSRCVSRWVPDRVSEAQRPDSSEPDFEPSPRLSPKDRPWQHVCQPALLQLISACRHVFTLQKRSCLVLANKKAAGGLLSCLLAWKIWLDTVQETHGGFLLRPFKPDVTYQRFYLSSS